MPNMLRALCARMAEADEYLACIQLGGASPGPIASGGCGARKGVSVGG